MQQVVTSQNHEFQDVIIQHEKDQMSVGVGLAYSGKSGTHPLDIYSHAETQEVIGRLFSERLNSSPYVGFSTPEFKDSSEEKGFYQSIGSSMIRCIRDSTTAGDQLWTWLDRPGTNRLIRLLRNARDAAFGRDE